jgi:hypothetical protein
MRNVGKVSFPSGNSSAIAAATAEAATGSSRLRPRGLDGQNPPNPPVGTFTNEGQ